MIRITDAISLEDEEVRMDFVRASGPGGQNVNKVATAVQLRFDVTSSPSLPTAVKARLCRLAGRRMNDEGLLIIDARRHRTQKANRADALDRLVALIRRAAAPPKTRIPTRPTAASRTRRLEAKKRRARTKRLRTDLPED